MFIVFENIKSLPHFTLVFLLLNLLFYGCKQDDFDNTINRGNLQPTFILSDSTKQVIILKNSSINNDFNISPYLESYMYHWGIPYLIHDLIKGEYPSNLSSFSLIIIGQENLFDNDSPLDIKLKNLFLNDLSKTMNVVSFDPHVLHDSKTKLGVLVNQVEFGTKLHFITQNHTESLKFFQSNIVTINKNDNEEIIIEYNGHYPFLSTLNYKNSKLVLWYSAKWMSTDYLGPMAGLDDCLLRSFIWVAKKPFVFRGLPPIVTMRIDDVGGYGFIVKQSPLYWLKILNKYNFKPWLGLYIDYLNDEAIIQLKDAINAGMATASPHAFQPAKFIYFDHNNQKSWDDSILKSNLSTVDNWYRKNQPLPMSKYLIPHFYEIGENVLPHLINSWNIQYVGLNMNLNIPRTSTSPWLKSGPFRTFEIPGTASSYIPMKGNRPVYYADFLDDKQQLFNCLTEIRDISGYEWYPNNDVENTSQNGIKSIARAIDAMALAVLFTHEEVHLSGLKPENLEKIFFNISDGIKGYKPILLTMDDALNYVKATKTSWINKVHQDEDIYTIDFIGNSAVKTGYYFCTENNDKITLNFESIPAFNNSYQYTIHFP